MSNQPTFSIEFAEHEIPTMIHALQIQRNCMMMSGGGEIARQALQGKVDALVAHMPLYMLFDEVVWYRIHGRIKDAAEFSVYEEYRGWGSTGHVVVLQIGEHKYKSSYSALGNGDGPVAVTKMIDLLQKWAPLDSKHIVLDPLKERDKEREAAEIRRLAYEAAAKARASAEPAERKRNRKYDDDDDNW